VQFFLRYSALTVLVACLGLSLLMMSTADNPATDTVQSLFRPMQRSLAWSVQSITGFWNRYLFLAGVEKSHEWAMQELSRTRRQIIELQEASKERDRLRALLGFQQKLSLPTIAARVIGWDTSAFAESFTVDRGERDGIQPNYCVTTSDGLIGRVQSVSKSSCQVQLILDELSNVAATIQKNRVPGTVTGQGAGKPLLMRYVAKSAEVAVHDAVVTSGIDGIYHKGLLIGYVSRVDVDSSSLFQKVEVRPSVELDHVEEVLVFDARPNDSETPPEEPEPGAVPEDAAHEGTHPQ
jgi:rod shape-determining protein MreC